MMSGQKRPFDDGYAAMPSFQVDAVNQALAQHQAVIQMQSDAAQVLGTVSGLVASLGGGYPAEQLQAVASQVETLRGIHARSTQALHTSHTALQNLLSQASTVQLQPQPQQPQQVQLQQQLQQPQPQQPQPQPVQPQQVPYGATPLMQQQPPPMQQPYLDVDPFGPGAVASPSQPFVDPLGASAVASAGMVEEKRKTVLCNNFASGRRAGMVEAS